MNSLIRLFSPASPLWQTMASSLRTPPIGKPGSFSSARQLHVGCRSQTDKTKSGGDGKNENEGTDKKKLGGRSNKTSATGKLDNIPEVDITNTQASAENLGKLPSAERKQESPRTSIANFQIYKSIPKDVDEIFLNQHERFRYRRLNELYKRELNEVFLKEKDKTRVTRPADVKEKGSSPADRNKPTQVLNKNVFYDEKLDSMVKNLISETKSVLTKMAGISTPPSSVAKNTVTPSIKRFYEIREQIKMAHDKHNAPASKSSGSGGGGSSDNAKPPASYHGGSKGDSGPPVHSGDIVVSPYVDSKGNIDYTKAVVKSSSQGDASASNILKKLIQDPVKPLPIFTIGDYPLQKETVVIGDRVTKAVPAKTSTTGDVPPKQATKPPSIPDKKSKAETQWKGNLKDTLMIDIDAEPRNRANRKVLSVGEKSFKPKTEADRSAEVKKKPCKVECTSKSRTNNSHLKKPSVIKTSKTDCKNIVVSKKCPDFKNIPFSLRTEVEKHSKPKEKTPETNFNCKPKVGMNPCKQPKNTPVCKDKPKAKISRMQNDPCRKIKKPECCKEKKIPAKPSSDDKPNGPCG
ncbi:hypothetical protein M8J76_005880 [Diaphorina citri]|nr:hypothetical protein M8J76_005880 [Diaphorina citri]